MATTKVRKSTPMKNKTKLWRRLAKKVDGVSNGRSIRQQTTGFNLYAGATPLVAALMKRMDVDVKAIFEKWHPKKEVKNETE